MQSLRWSRDEGEPAQCGAGRRSEKQPRSMHDARRVMCCHASSPARCRLFSATALCAVLVHAAILQSKADLSRWFAIDTCAVANHSLVFI